MLSNCCTDAAALPLFHHPYIPFCGPAFVMECNMQINRTVVAATLVLTCGALIADDRREDPAPKDDVLSTFCRGDAKPTNKKVHDYLANLQRAHVKNPPLSTPQQREAFCRQWQPMMAAFELSSNRLPPEDATKFSNCEYILQIAECTRQTPYSNPETDLMKLMVERNVRQAVASLELPAPPPTIGSLSTGLLNAKCIRVPDTDETLIVVNDQVFVLPYGIAKT